MAHGDGIRIVYEPDGVAGYTCRASGGSGLKGRGSRHPGREPITLPRRKHRRLLEK
jgi:hypothetical protein